MRILILDKDAEGLEETVELVRDVSPSCHLLPMQIDVLDEGSVEQALSYVKRNYGEIDYAVNCAG
jgi:NAD(P)-dependent dehydrogenase (short-subunit alcohol dehydrogenase family)